MIFRRIKSHIAKEDWFAVLIDFVIVVFGVFVGMQVDNWNEVRGDKAEYARALERLRSETAINRATIDNIDAEIATSLEIVGEAFDALLVCKDSEQNRRIVNAGIEEIRGTNGLYLQRNALEELTFRPRLLSQQSASERQHFTDMLFYFDLMQGQAKFVEFHPLENRVEDISILKIGPRQSFTTEFFGTTFSETRRALILSEPIDVACRNNQLKKAFITWENWQSDLPSMTAQIRKELDDTQVILDELSTD